MQAFYEAQLKNYLDLGAKDEQQRFKVIETHKVITHINWSLIDIKVIAESVRKLQNRIVKAKIAGRNRTVKKFQSLLVK